MSAARDNARSSARTAAAGGARTPRVIALMNQKGGVGKTTTTVNLAAAIAEAGKRVLVIDLDPQAHATLHLGVDPAGAGNAETDAGAEAAASPSIYDLLLNPALDAASALRPARDNLHVLAAETDLAALETELSDLEPADRVGRLRRVLGTLADRFDIVLIDCPPSLGVLTLNGLAAADEVVIPMQAHFLALQGVGKLLETVGMVRSGLNPALRVSAVVVCMFDAQTTHSREVVDDLRSFLAQTPEDADLAGAWQGAVVLDPPIRRNIKLAECPSFGKTILDYAPWCPGALDYRAVAQALLDLAGDSAPAKPAPAVQTARGGRSAARARA